MNDQTKEIENGGSAQRFIHKYSKSLAHTHHMNGILTCRVVGQCAMARVIFLVIFLLLLSFTLIRGWNGHDASLDGVRECTQLSLAVEKNDISTANGIDRSVLQCVSHPIHFSILFLFFSLGFFEKNYFIWFRNGRSIAAHTSAQFYGSFSSKRVEKFVRIFYMHRFLSQLKAIQWGHRRQPQQQQQQMVTRHRPDTQTNKSKGFWHRWCVRTGQYHQLSQHELARCRRRLWGSLEEFTFRSNVLVHWLIYTWVGKGKHRKTV